MGDRFKDDVTRYLNRLGNGEEALRVEFYEIVYGQLHSMAHAQMARQSASHTLSPTALVNEAWMKVSSGEGEGVWNDRTHFFSTAARAMRHILVDHARAKRSDKRGGGMAQVTLDENLGGKSVGADEILGLEVALEKLGAVDPELDTLVHLRFFAGLSNQEIADQLDMGLRTVERRWQTAKLWLMDEMQGA